MTGLASMVTRSVPVSNCSRLHLQLVPATRPVLSAFIFWASAFAYALTSTCRGLPFVPCCLSVKAACDAQCSSVLHLLGLQKHSDRIVLQALAKQLADARLREQGSLDAEPSHSGLPDQQSLHGEDGMKPTLLVAPADCYSHKTCPEPITRGGQEPPPENVHRLKVLTHPGKPVVQHSLTYTLFAMATPSMLFVRQPAGTNLAVHVQF